MDLAPHTINSLRTVLLGCSEFDSDESLRDVFVTKELGPFKSKVPARDNPGDRVDSAISFLLSSEAGEELCLLIPFLVFLKDKRERIGDRDASMRLESILIQIKKEIALPGRDVFQLQFHNRDAELELVERYLRDRNVQIHAASGLGKTAFLKELQRRHSQLGARTVWIDFVAADDKDCASDRFGFLSVFIKQAIPDKTPDISRLGEDAVWRRIQVPLSDIDDLTLLIDNADRGSDKVLVWLRDTFVKRVTTRVPKFKLVTSGKDKVPDWVDRPDGMLMFPLSGLNAPKVIEAIILGVIDRFGSNKAKLAKDNNDEAWLADLELMKAQVLEISSGHPLVIERVLHYYHENDNFGNPNFIKDNWSEIVDRCLEPVVGGYILPILARNIRHAFEELCIFRYVWPSLLESIAQADPIDDSAKLWSSLRSSIESHGVLSTWFLALDTHLVSDVTSHQMWEISPVTRQVIATVLKSKDKNRYADQNRWARDKFKELMLSGSDSDVLKAAHFLEALYHTTQAQEGSSDEARQDVEQIVESFLNVTSGDVKFSVARNDLKKWLRSDYELEKAVSAVTGDDVYSWIINSF